MRIEAKEGFTFKRIHDGFIMGYEEVAKIDKEFPYNE